MKKAIFAALALSAILASSAMAASYKGKWGPTVMDSSHPLGLAFGMGDNAALDVGIGFSKTKGVELGWDVGLGFRSAMVRSDNANLGVRVAASFGQSEVGFDLDRGTVDEDKLKTFGVELGLYGEWWPSSNLSFHVHHGIEYSSSKVGDGASVSRFGTQGDLMGDAGFTLWWGGK